MAHTPRVREALVLLLTIPALTFCGAAETVDAPNADTIPEPAPIAVTVAKPAPPAFFVVAPDAGPATVPQHPAVVVPADPAKHPGPLPPPCPNCPDPRGLPTEPPVDVPR